MGVVRPGVRPHVVHLEIGCCDLLSVLVSAEREWRKTDWHLFATVRAGNPARDNGDLLSQRPFIRVTQSHPLASDQEVDESQEPPHRVAA